MAFWGEKSIYKKNQKKKTKTLNTLHKSDKNKKDTNWGVGTVLDKHVSDSCLRAVCMTRENGFNSQLGTALDLLLE